MDDGCIENSGVSDDRKKSEEDLNELRGVGSGGRKMEAVVTPIDFWCGWWTLIQSIGGHV